MMLYEPMNVAERSDADLVAESLGGSREAFHQIVERYQTLICSLAYSATGNLSQSEDVAQETFIAAWRDLRSLREPNKLRSWLCAIVRNRIHRNLRNDSREPVCGAVALEVAQDVPALEALPSEQTSGREEEAILWRSVGKIPEAYREPLILFYRQHQSIEQVAAELELSEDAVKQRLSRGRKFLQQEVEAFVENTLRRTAPGQSFSGAVLAALPMTAGPAAAAGAVSKGTAAKSGFLAMWVAPFIGILAGIFAQWLVIRATTTDAKLRARMILQIIAGWIVLMGIAIAGPNAVSYLRHYYGWNDRLAFVATACFWCSYAMGLQTITIIGFGRMLRASQCQDEDRETLQPTLAPATLGVVVSGVHLMLFSWLVRLAWRADDLLAAATIAGIMVVLGVAAFCKARGCHRAALARACNSHVALCGALILTMFNLRFDVWAASAYGVSVAEIANRVPTWIVPTLSLVFLIWSGVVLAAVRARPRL
jgi:RNA polymerase sigma factor (sigma-70 family)